MTDVVVSFPFTEAVLDALKANGMRVGDARRPDGPSPAPASFYPYVVVRVGTVRMEGDYVEPKQDGLQQVTATAVGMTRQSAETARDQASAFLLDTSSLDIDGYVVVWTEHVFSPEIIPDYDVKPPLFNAPVIVNLYIAPASTGS